uniref:Carboxylic ester hydrolase n=1 Tax=Meloidogyne javanica TaxID=6303 RepID=A0A915MCT9_MELJA
MKSLIKPKSIPKWKGIRLATQPPPACIYHAWPEGFDKKEKNYSEDCLYLNIFAPKIRKTPEPIQLYPILFIIHGGGFDVGSSHEYHNYTEIGKRFVSQGIIVISIHYRLGWIGFGSTGNDELPGNLGLWDMVAALKYVRQNIKSFGGDPDKITIYGYSAGGASVSLLSASPHSQGLFKRVIQMSGSPLAAWALNERTVNETVNLAKAIDVNFSKWSPRIDGDFLPKDFPQLIANAEPKQTIMGFVDLETLLWTQFMGRNNTLAAYAIPWQESKDFDIQQFKDKVKRIVAKTEFFGEKIANELANEIVEFYLNNDPLIEFNRLENATASNYYYLQRYTLLLTDLQFIISVINDAQLKIKNGWPIYLYYNLHYNIEEFPKEVKIHQNFHTNDENFIFHYSPFNFTLNEEDLSVERFLVLSFVNFIKFGNPSIYEIKWHKATQKMPTRHVRINGQHTLENHYDLDLLARQEFFQRISIKYGHIWDLVRGGPEK